MRIINAIVSLGLLLWIDAASAEQPISHFLTVGHHNSVEMDDDKADRILAQASKVLDKCNVVLKRKDSVGKFVSSHTPAIAKDVPTRDAIFGENFDVKVVGLFSISFCRVEQPDQFGCAWDPPSSPKNARPRHRSIIVADLPVDLAGKMWAHEFGHMTGLPHRPEKRALMACRVRDAEIISETECDCLRQGRGACDQEPEPAEKCALP